MFTILVAVLVFCSNYILFSVDLATSLNTSFYVGYWMSIWFTGLVAVIYAIIWLASLGFGKIEVFAATTILAPFSILFSAISIAGWYLMMGAVAPGTEPSEWNVTNLVIGAVLVLLMALFARNSSSSSKKMTSGC